MKTRMLLPLLVLLTFVTLCGGWSGCEESLNSDPSFDAWCGDHLCDWRSDSGAVSQVPTWHEDDHGVSLVGDPAQISQRIVATPTCIRFQAMTDIAADASVELGIDLGDDGVIDYRGPMAATHWQSIEFTLGLPVAARIMRVSLRKSGPGRAVLAHIRLTTAQGCSSSIPWPDRPAAAHCEMNSECAGGRCVPWVFPYGGIGGGFADHWTTCGGCASSSDCKGGQVCGVVTAPLGMAAGCVPPPAGHLGDRCVGDDNCGGGLLCCEGVCSACCKTCKSGAACAQVTAPKGTIWAVRPWLCGPEQHQGKAGDPCTADADCASGACKGSGPLDVCWTDGRRCSAGSDCDPSFAALGQNADPTACIHLGVADGKCQ